MPSITVGSALLSVPDLAECVFVNNNPLICRGVPADPPVIGPGPVRYATGGVILQRNDLPGANGFGQPSGQSCSYTNLLAGTNNFGIGNNWLNAQWPMIVTTAGGDAWTGPAPQVGLVQPDGTTLPFTPVGSQYVPPFGSNIQLAYDDASQTYTQFNPDGRSITRSLPPEAVRREPITMQRSTATIR
jgi:hypothetical protein